MPQFTTHLNPLLNQVPGSVTAPMLHVLVRSLPPPDPGAPPEAAQQILQDMLAEIDAAGPRDRLEARLVVRQVALGAQADALMMRVTTETDPAQQERTQRRMLALHRWVDALGCALRRHRRALAADGMRHVPPWTQAVDVAALTAVWRDPAAVVAASVLTSQPTDPASIWPVAEAKPAPREAASGLEDRDEFEVPPKPKFAGVPLWQQHGKKWLDELTDEELAEVVQALNRGEEIAEPPPRPERVRHPKAEAWRREGNWISPEALAAPRSVEGDRAER